MATDDAETTPFMMSTAAWHAIMAIVDHLRCFRDSLITSRTPTTIETLVRSHSQYTLLQAAFENASWAVWLLASNDRVERISRRFQVEVASIEAVARLNALAAKTLHPTKADRIARLRSLARKAGLTAAQVQESTKAVGNREAIRGAAIAMDLDLSWPRSSGGWARA